MRPASVTTSDEMPVRATHLALDEPGRRARGQRQDDRQRRRGRPPWCAEARTQAENAITDATDRSISPLMMTNVIDTAMITFSIDSRNRFTKLSTSR